MFEKMHPAVKIFFIGLIVGTFTGAFMAGLESMPRVASLAKEACDG